MAELATLNAEVARGRRLSRRRRKRLLHLCKMAETSGLAELPFRELDTQAASQMPQENRSPYTATHLCGIREIKQTIREFASASLREFQTSTNEGPMLHPPVWIPWVNS